MVTVAAEALGRVVAVAPAMRELLQIATRLADARSAVLLQGDSGTGKDLLAHWIHYRGARRDGPFIKIHCPSIPEDLLESELFGHEKGAFTDARAPKAGKIELASGGTLYFDQIQDLTPALQAKLLRVVEERRFERLGGTRTLEVDVRFVSASNGDLRQAVGKGTFRDDLYHRLSVVPLTLPPLRERREDILPLADTFLQRERERGATKARRFDDDSAARPPLARQRARAALGGGARRALRGRRGDHLRRAARAHPGAAVRALGRARPAALAARGRAGVHPLRPGAGQGVADAGRGHPGHQPQGPVGEAATLRHTVNGGHYWRTFRGSGA
jgi:sigma54-dependent transcription regulator